MLKANNTKETQMTSSEYADVMEGVFNEYGPKAMALLHRVRDACVAAGLVAGDPVDFSVDVYEWHVIIYQTPLRVERTSVVVSVEIPEERDFEGGDGFGVEFALKVAVWGGGTLRDFQPFTLTPQAWVDARQPELIARRWQLIEDTDVSEIPALIAKGD
jgi:hypothetical protein